MKEIYLLVMYWPGDKEAGKNVETHLGFWENGDEAQLEANKLNAREGIEEKYFVRMVKPALTKVS
jgi:hypothetical protein